MQIEIKLDENYREPKIIIMTDKMTDEVNDIVKKTFRRTASINCRV